MKPREKMFRWSIYQEELFVEFFPHGMDQTLAADIEKLGIPFREIPHELHIPAVLHGFMSQLGKITAPTAHSRWEGIKAEAHRMLHNKEWEPSTSTSRQSGELKRLLAHYAAWRQVSVAAATDKIERIASEQAVTPLQLLQHLVLENSGFRREVSASNSEIVLSEL